MLCHTLSYTNFKNLDQPGLLVFHFVHFVTFEIEGIENDAIICLLLSTNHVKIFRAYKQ